MVNRRWTAWLVAALFTCLPLVPATRAADPERIKLAVLYVGKPQTERTKDFVAFLEKHFTKVGQGDVATFREQEVAGYDAVILDYGPVSLKGTGLQAPEPPFGKTYARPTIMVGTMAALVARRLHLRTGYS